MFGAATTLVSWATATKTASLTPPTTGRTQRRPNHRCRRLPYLRADDEPGVSDCGAATALASSADGSKTDRASPPRPMLSMASRRLRRVTIIPAH